MVSIWGSRLAALAKEEILTLLWLQYCVKHMSRHNMVFDVSRYQRDFCRGNHFPLFPPQSKASWPPYLQLRPGTASHGQQGNYDIKMSYITFKGLLFLMDALSVPMCVCVCVWWLPALLQVGTAFNIHITTHIVQVIVHHKELKYHYHTAEVISLKLWELKGMPIVLQ